MSIKCELCEGIIFGVLIIFDVVFVTVVTTEDGIIYDWFV